jgi:leucyl aminopeptidase
VLLKGGGCRHLAVAVAGHAPDATRTPKPWPAVADASTSTADQAQRAGGVEAASVSLVCDKAEAAAVAAGLKRGQAIAAGTTLARECANRPGNHCTPTYLADQARKLGKAHGLKVEVLDRKDCEKLGMGSFLAVAQGSDEPPKFIVLRYQGAAKSWRPWCWWARASPSTPAASRSSRAPRWTR